MRSKFFFPFALTLAVASGAVRAEEPAGCEQFKWPIQRERAALEAPERKVIAADSVLNAGSSALVLLAPVETFHFPLTPERPPTPQTFAAMLKLAAPAAGVYTVSLSASAWIDVIQDGVPLKPLDFTGVRECPHIRKSLKYRLA